MLLKYLLVKEIIYPLIIILLSILLWLISKKIINKLFSHKIKRIEAKKQKTIKSLISNIVKVFIIIIAILMILDVYGIDTKSLITSLGVVGLVLGLALQDFLKDFISGMTIILENQYCIGDIVTIDGFKGEVIYLSMKSTRIKSATGEVKILANRMITDVINHNLANSLAIVDIDVAYNSDIDSVEKIIKNACLRLSSTKNVIGDIECLGIQNIRSSKVTFRVIANTVSNEQYNIERIIRKEIKKVLDKNNIEIPYEQVVVHNAK